MFQISSASLLLIRRNATPVASSPSGKMDRSSGKAPRTGTRRNSGRRIWICERQDRPSGAGARRPRISWPCGKGARRPHSLQRQSVRPWLALRLRPLRPHHSRGFSVPPFPRRSWASVSDCLISQPAHQPFPIILAAHPVWPIGFARGWRRSDPGALCNASSAGAHRPHRLRYSSYDKGTNG